MGKLFPADAPDITYRMYDCGTGNYWFYHKGAFPADAPLYYSHLVNTATSYIEMWDPYFNVTGGQRDVDIFDNIQQDITIKILTRKGLDAARSYLSAVENSLKTKIPASKSARFGLRVINDGDKANQGNWFFHDRFLIIDKTDVYIVGSSVGWHLISRESTGIYKVSDTETAAFIMSLFNEYWKQAAMYEIPVKFLHI